MNRAARGFLAALSLVVLHAIRGLAANHAAIPTTAVRPTATVAPPAFLQPAAAIPSLTPSAALQALTFPIAAPIGPPAAVPLQAIEPLKAGGDALIAAEKTSSPNGQSAALGDLFENQTVRAEPAVDLGRADAARGDFLKKGFMVLPVKSLISTADIKALFKKLVKMRTIDPYSIPDLNLLYGFFYLDPADPDGRSFARGDHHKSLHPEDPGRTDFSSYARVYENGWHTSPVFNAISEFVDRFTGHLNAHLPADEQMQLERAQIRASNGDAPAGKPHPDGGYIRVTLSLLGDGTIFFDGTEQAQAPTGAALVFTGSDREEAKNVKALIHATPASSGPRLLLVLTYKLKGSLADQAVAPQFRVPEKKNTFRIRERIENLVFRVRSL